MRRLSFGRSRLRLVPSQTGEGNGAEPLAGLDVPPGALPAEGRAVAVFGATGGVGKTNFGLYLAAALARLCRVLLLEMDQSDGDVETLVPERATATFEEVGRGLAPLDAVCARGAFGLRMMTRSSGLAPVFCGPGRHAEALQERLRQWRPGFDRTVILAPSTRGPEFWRVALEADDSVLVTTATPAGVAEAYALARELSLRSSQRRFHLAFNFTRDEVSVRRAFVALRAGIEGRLGAEARLVGCIPLDQSLAAVIRRRGWLLEEHPDCPSSRAFESIARALVYSGLEEASPVARRSLIQRLLLRSAA